MATRKPNISRDLSEALKSHKPYAKKGYLNAVSAVNMLDSTVSRATDELQTEIYRLEYSNIKDDVVYKSLAEQLSKIKSNYSLLPAKLREDINQVWKVAGVL